ncbi:MAG: Ig-like domain-containing protein, partial [Thiothrix sp.]|nr:Ig-like domain-containing protein [Thiothrix sp.]
SDDSNYDFGTSEDAAQTAANESATLAPLFDPANGIIPQTNDLLFQGSTDGTLNIPTTGASGGTLALYNTLNTLDGFGLTTPITAGFSTGMDPDSVRIGKSVYLFEITKDAGTGAVTAVKSSLGSARIHAGTNATADTVVLMPLKPLRESTSYMVVLTNSILDTDGAAAASPSAYLLAKAGTSLTGTAYAALEPLRQLIATQEAAAALAGVARQRIILSWTFTTQSVTPVMTATRELAKAGSTLQLSQAVATTADINASLSGHANIHAGVLQVPYYLDAVAPLSGYWQGAGGSFLTRYNPTPVATGTQTIPVLMTVPNANALAGGTAPEGGWPVVIFQHGITRNRTDLLAIADTLADAGKAVIAIDLPLHGVTDTGNPFYAGTGERTFDLDLQNNATGATGADGVIDDSGAYFINLGSLLTTRDNARQAISDLLILRRSLGSVSTVSLNDNSVGFVGLSLGAMVGTSYLSQENRVTPASLAAPGGGVARLLDASPTFGPVIHAGLAANGVTQGSSAYDSFMAAFQMVVDPIDPVVLGAKAAARHPVHLMEIVGVNGLGADDVVVNSVDGWPLSGTEPLIRVMGLPAITETTPNTSGAVRFSEGCHGSLLSPECSPAATVEMQTETAFFQASGGNAIVISNPAVIATE